MHRPAWLVNAATSAASVLTLMVCLGFGPAVTLFSAAGVRLLVNEAVLLILLLVFLPAGGVSLHLSRQRHGNAGPLMLHIVAAVLAFFFTFAIRISPLAWLGVAGIVFASFWDWYSARCSVRAQPPIEHKRTPPPSSS